jgi:hypothetical protein
MEKDINKDKLQKVYEMKKTWVEINHLLERKTQFDHMECKG